MVAKKKDIEPNLRLTVTYRVAMVFGRETIDDPTGTVLVVSGMAEAGAAGGGVFLIKGGTVETVDECPTTGLFFDEESVRWLRATSGRHVSSATGEIYEYSRSGSRVRVRHLTTVLDAHDVISTASGRIAVATYGNALIKMARYRTRPVLVLPGEPDSWHINCIENVGGQLFASAFHRGGTFRQWAGELYGSGFVFSLLTGAVVADGLSTPHSPRFADGLWLICDSARNDLVAVDPQHPSERVRKLALGGYTRGLAVGPDHLYVGISARRRAGDRRNDTASLAIVDRRTWSVVDRCPIPCPEIYDVRLVPTWAPSMLATPLPESQHDGNLRARGEKRPTGTTKGSGGIPAGISIRFVPPKAIHAGEVLFVRARFEHDGLTPLSLTHNGAINLAYRWTAMDGSTPVCVQGEEPLRTALPATVHPRSSIDVDVVVRAPAIPGRYRFRIVLVEEGVSWADTIDPEAFLEMNLDVR